MQVKGKIIEKLPLRSGTSSRGAWSCAQIVVAFQDGQYVTNICLQNINKAAEFNALAVGSEGIFDFSVSSRKGQQGSWFTQCTCYKWQIDSAPAVDDLP